MQEVSGDRVYSGVLTASMNVIFWSQGSMGADKNEKTFDNRRAAMGSRILEVRNERFETRSSDRRSDASRNAHLS